ncbi:helix-turn-helix domain-containing protein [Paenibacillus cellulosilyticus]|uniref:helix-turn-helix domain-containing protein n=1 Tax=Paenibacillus cellulosilyticus TaxID=375489 RepID=UPI003CCC5779
MRGNNSSLSRLEFRLLNLLVVRQNRVVKFDELISHTWGNLGGMDRQGLYVFISRLRNKIEYISEDGPRIICIRDLGYLLRIHLD